MGKKLFELTLDAVILAVEAYISVRDFKRRLLGPRKR